MSGLYFLYGAPFGELHSLRCHNVVLIRPSEIIIAGVFLYQILGVASLAGFAVLFSGWPLNTLLSRWSFALRKRQLEAKDKRMSVLNELIAAVRIIILIFHNLFTPWKTDKTN